MGNGSNFRLRAAPRSKRSDSKKTAFRKSTGIFVSRIAKSTRSTLVEKHIEQETGLKVKCEALVTKYGTYMSFFVRIAPKDQRHLLAPDVWPKGAIVRPFYE
jgi:hypothetical protein